MDNNKPLQPQTVGPWFHAVCTAITSCIVVILVYINLQYFDAQEQIPQVETVPTLALNKDIPHIRTGIFIRDISEFDIIKDKFTFNVVVWFAFDPKKIAQELVSQFVFEKAKEEFRSDVVMRLNSEDERIIEYTLTLSTSMSLNYRHFPLDDHRLSLTLGNYVIPPTQGIFVTESDWIVMNPEIHVEGWKYVNKEAVAGHFINSVNPNNSVQTFDHGRVVFSLDFERSGIRHMVSVILPMLIIFFVTLFSFSIRPAESDYYNVVSLSVASIMALIAYRFVIETVSPSTAYFTLSDYVFMFFLVATIGVLFINALGEDISRRQKQYITVLLHIFIILVFTYFLAPWW